jgi:hypothetical protein
MLKYLKIDNMTGITNISCGKSRVIIESFHSFVGTTMTFFLTDYVLKGVSFIFKFKV